MKQLTLVVAGAIASRVNGLSVVMSKSTDAEKKDVSASGQNGFQSPPTRTDKCNLSIMMCNQNQLKLLCLDQSVWSFILIVYHAVVPIFHRATLKV